MPKAKKLLSHINKTFGTLAFCRRWLERDDGGSSTINGNTVNKEINYTFLIYLFDIFFCLFINYIKLINYSFDCLCLYFCIKFTLFFIYLFNYLFICSSFYFCIYLLFMLSFDCYFSALYLLRKINVTQTKINQI